MRGNMLILARTRLLLVSESESEAYLRLACAGKYVNFGADWFSV